MGSSCCSGNDTMPSTQSRDPNTEMKEPLMETSDSEQNSLEGVQIDLESSTLIAYILSPELTAFDLSGVWETADPDHTGRINIEKDLQNIFITLIHHYIKSKTGRDAKDTPHQEPAHALSSSLVQHFQTILSNYNYNEGDIMTKHFFIDNFQKYLAEPNPKADEVIEPGTPASDATSTKVEEAFDMLSFISTSGTIRADGDFVVDHSVSILREAIESKDKDRGSKVGQILASLTEAQRVEMRTHYVGRKDQSLPSALEETFNGDLLSVLTALCRSNASNDAEWIEASRNKLNTNWSVINEILMSRTNSQLAAIKDAYFSRFRRDLLTSMLQSFNDKGAYGNLLKRVLTDNPNVLRKEFHPRDVKSKAVRDDAKILHHMLENTKGKVNKLKVIEMLCDRSWAHIALLCKEYGKKSNYDLKTVIEKKFGKNSKSGDAVQKMIDISRNRHSFFAQLLFQSMKGISVNDEMLIRIIVGRSEIDLGEISAAFSQKYGNGKTLLQFIRSNAHKGTYRNILLRICAIGDHVFDELSADHERESGQLYSTDDDIKVVETEDSQTPRSQSDVDGGEQKDSDTPRQTWDEYIRCSPTMRPFPGFEAHVTAQQLITVMANKKTEKDAKKLLVKTLTMIDNKQRQELKKAFIDLHPKGTALSDATQDTLRKGKTMVTMLGLLQRPSEFHYFWIKQAIKSKKLELLMEILTACSNHEIRKLQDVYKDKESAELIDHIDRVIGKKPAAKSLIARILECKRPETIKPDRKLCKIHLTDMHKLIKEKNHKQCKQFFGTLFVENSYSQINYEANKFNTASENTLASVVKKVMGSGPSGVIIEHIMKMATDRFGFYAEKLRESMKGITISEQVLIRILVGRAEKDLGDIVQHFAEENYGEGKTLRQWVERAFNKGSFQTTLLRIADVSDGSHGTIHEFEEDADDIYDSQTETITPEVIVESAPFIKAASAHVYSTSKPLNKRVDSPPRIVVSSPQTVDNEIKLAKRVKSTDDYSNVNEEEKVTEGSEVIAADAYDPYDINEKEFGTFILEKVNEKTAKKLMQHLKAGKNKIGEDEVIKPKQVITVMLFACVLYLKYTEKVKKAPEIQVDKKKLKQALMPAFNWMLEHRFDGGSVPEYNVSYGLSTGEYKRLGRWLIEYYETKQKQ